MSAVPSQTVMLASGANEPARPGVCDEDLAAAAARGDRASFDVLVDRHAARLLRFVLVRVRDPHDAEEVVQEALLRAWGALDRYDPGRRFSTWLYTIARNQATSVVRARRVGIAIVDGELPAARPESRGPTTGVWATAAGLLGEGEYECLWLRYVEDRTPPEIAAITGRSAVGVRVMLHRARGRLREALAREEGS